MNKLLKRIALTVLSASLITSSFGATACGHTHTPGAVVKENEIAATCTAGGSYDEAVYCTECKEEISREHKTTEKSAHTPAAAVKEKEVAPTCTEEGSYEEVINCSVCKTEISRTTKTVAKADHTPSEAVEENRIDATCAEEGSYEEVITCSECDEEISRTTKVIAKISHEYGTTYSSDATGHWYRCLNCTDKKDFHAHVPGPAATEETAQTCTECGYVLAAAIGHEHSLTKVATVSATCTTNGNIEYYTCGCTQWFSDSEAKNLIADHDSVVVKAAHTLQTVAAVEPGCSTTGNIEYFTCGVCNKWFKDENARTEITNHNSVNLKATGHSYSKDWTSDDNYHWHAATCEHSEQKGSRMLHSWDEGKVEGTVKTFTCGVCGKTKTENVAEETFVGERFIVKHEEGKTVTYKFEAECTNLGGKSGPGWSGNTGGKSMAVVAEAADNGSVVSFLYKYGVSVNFVVVSDRDVEDAVLKLRVGAEFIDMLVNATTFGVRVDPVNDADLEEGGAWGSWDADFLNFYDDKNEDGAPFAGYWIDAYECGEIHIDATNGNKKVVGIDDFVITTKLSLKKGANSISFITLNKQSVGGTMEACAPVIDGIKITTTAQLGLYDPQDNGFGALNAVIEG